MQVSAPAADAQLRLELNVLANLNRRLLGEILGRPQIQVTVKQEPVVFPLKEPKDDGG